MIDRPNAAKKAKESAKYCAWVIKLASARIPQSGITIETNQGIDDPNKDANKAPADGSSRLIYKSRVERLAFLTRGIWIALRSIEPQQQASKQNVEKPETQGGSRITNAQQSNHSQPSCVEGHKVGGI